MKQRINRRQFVLTASEEALMNIFWANDKPLTSVELKELCADYEWNQEYILNMLRSIKKKGMVEICGTIQYRTQYARCFRATLTRAEYAAKLALSTGIDERALAETTVAMVRASCDTEKVIEELERIIGELEEEGKTEK